MKQVFRRTAMLLVVALLTTALAGCKAGTPGSVAASDSGASTSTSGSTSASTSASEPTVTPEPTHEPGLFVDDKKIEAEPIMTVDGQEVPFDMYRQMFLSTRQSFDGGDTSIWETEEGKEGLTKLMDYVKERVLSYYAIDKLAKDLNISITDEERETAEKDLEKVKTDMGGDEAYQQALAAQYYTEDLYLDLYFNSLLLNKIVRAEYGAEIKDLVLNTYARVQHILIQFESTEEGADHSKELKTAEEVLAKVKKGDDFSQLVKEYNQDPGQPEEGYYFTSGQMVEPFEKAGFALGDNATSEIVETTYGYHILKRLPMEEDYIEENLMNFFNQDLQTKLFERLDGISAKFDVKYHDSYDQVGPTTMF